MTKLSSLIFALALSAVLLATTALAHAPEDKDDGLLPSALRGRAKAVQAEELGSPWARCPWKNDAGWCRSSSGCTVSSPYFLPYFNYVYPSNRAAD